MPSACSEPRGAIHCCDNQCSEHAFRFNQIRAMVTEEGGEAHTINVYKLCYSERFVRQGEQPLKGGGMERNCRVKRLAVVGYGRFLGVNNSCAGCGNTSLSKEHGQKKVLLADGAKEKHEGIQGQWHQEPPFEEVLEQFTGCSDTNCDAYMMRRAYHAGKSGRGVLEKRKAQRMDLSQTQGSLRQGCLGGCRPPEHCTGHPSEEH